MIQVSIKIPFKLKRAFLILPPVSSKYADYHTYKEEGNSTKTIITEGGTKKQGRNESKYQSLKPTHRPNPGTWRTRDGGVP